MDEVTFDSQLSFLLECFPKVDFEILTEAVLESGGSTPQAIDYVLTRTIDEDFINDSKDKAIHKDKGTLKIFKELQQFFPTVDQEILSAFILAHPEISNVDLLANELVNHLGQTFVSKSSLHSKSSRKVKRKDLESLINLPSDYCSWKLKSSSSSSSPNANDGDDHYQVQAQRKEVTVSNCAELILAVSELLKVGIKEDGDGDDANLKVDLEEIRKAIQGLHQERIELLKKAAEAYSKGGLTGTCSAQFYSSQSSLKWKKIEESSRRAAYLTFVKFNNANGPENTIDLHGLTVAEVIPIIDFIVQVRIDSSKKFNSPPFVLRLVAGAGRHSIAGPRLGPAIWKRLCELDVPFNYDGSAAFLLYN